MSTLKQLTVIGILVVSSVSLHAQELLTSSAFFDQVAQRYGAIEDYTADVVISNENTVSRGVLFFRAPGMVRIDFDVPADQIIVSDGERLQVFIPRYNVVLSQELRRRSEESLASLASEQGLRLLRQNYSIAYLDSPGMVPLDPQSDVMVTKLRLNWRNPTEGYRQLVLSIDSDMVIRRISGVTADYREVEFDFRNVQLNVGIPESRFDYRGPASANTVHDFLFEGER
jgi:outer membrane lipoprotein-sorting protein